MLHTIKKVEYLEGYKLLLTFSDKKKKIVDLKKYSKESPETVFYPFRDLAFFKSVKVDKYTGTIVWPNGVDLCPDVLYFEGIEMGETVKKSPRAKGPQSSNFSSFKPCVPIAAKSKY